jgi:hypothetical protein
MRGQVRKVERIEKVEVLNTLYFVGLPISPSPPQMRQSVKRLGISHEPITKTYALATTQHLEPGAFFASVCLWLGDRTTD